MTEVKTYRAKPVQAIQWTGGNWRAIEDFTGGVVQQAPRTPALRLGSEHSIEIAMPEGIAAVEPGDWVVRDTGGKFYLCKPGDFAADYDEVSS